MRRMRSLCWASAANGHAAAEPTIPLVKLRRRIASPGAQDHADGDTDRRLQQGSVPCGMGFGVTLHSSNLDLPMSALGQKQTLPRRQPMSALPPKADMAQDGRDVCYVPKADICTAAIRRPARASNSMEMRLVPQLLCSLQVA